MTPEEPEQLSDFTGGPPASAEMIALLERSLGVHLPGYFHDFLGAHDGAEGFLGGNYLILWSAAEIARYNESYQVNEYAPGLVLFGSNGGGEGYAFNMRTEAKPVVMVPFVGMSLEYVKPTAPTFQLSLEKLKAPMEMRKSERRGNEIFEVHPVILGGSPVDKGNKVVLARQQHIEAVRYWNRMIRNLRSKLHD